MELVTYHQFVGILCYTWGFAFGLGFSRWAGSFLSMFGVVRKTVLPLVVASQSLLGRWVEHLKFCLFSRTVEFYLGRGATWVVGLLWMF